MNDLGDFKDHLHSFQTVEVVFLLMVMLLHMFYLFGGKINIFKLID